MLGDRLKELRIKKGATQDDLAELLKVKRQTYSAYERNISLPDITSIIVLASFFGVPLSYLLSDEIDKIQGGSTFSSEQERLLSSCSTLSEDDLQKVIEYAALLGLRHTQSND